MKRNISIGAIALLLASCSQPQQNATVLQTPVQAPVAPVNLQPQAPVNAPVAPMSTIPVNSQPQVALSTANSQSPIPQKTSGQWTFVDQTNSPTTGGGFFYPPYEFDIDPSFVKNGQYRFFWTRSLFAYPSDFQHLNVKVALSNDVIDCNNHTVNNRISIFINTSGKIVSSSVSPQTQLVPIIPNSFNDELYNLVCSQ